MKQLLQQRKTKIAIAVFASVSILNLMTSSSIVISVIIGLVCSIATYAFSS